MSPENQWLEDVFPIEHILLLGAMLNFGGGNLSIPPPKKNNDPPNF